MGSIDGYVFTTDIPALHITLRHTSHPQTIPMVSVSHATLPPTSTKCYPKTKERPGHYSPGTPFPELN